MLLSPHALPCSYKSIVIFSFEECALCFFFNTLKMPNHCFLSSSTLFLQIRLFFCFQDFLFIFGFQQLFQSDQCSMVRDECINLRSTQSALCINGFECNGVQNEITTCPFFCISKKNIPLSEKIILIQFFLTFLLYNLNSAFLHIILQKQYITTG